MGIRYHVDVFDGVRDQFPIHTCTHPFLTELRENLQSEAGKPAIFEFAI